MLSPGVEQQLAVDDSEVSQTCDHASDFANMPLGAAIAGGRFDVVRLLVENVKYGLLNAHHPPTFCVHALGLHSSVATPTSPAGVCRQRFHGSNISLKDATHMPKHRYQHLAGAHVQEYSVMLYRLHHDTST